jgi:ribosome-binding protein aMBF1 (putative translation factor)
MTFDDWIKRAGLSERQIAKQLGLSQMAINHYRRLQRIPQSEIMQRIKKITGGEVTGAEWLDVREQRQEARKVLRQRKTVRRWRIDRQQFSGDIRQKRARDAMTFRELEKALCLDKAVLHRAEAGESLSDDNFAVLLRWLGQPASVYLKLYLD